MTNSLLFFIYKIAGHYKELRKMIEILDWLIVGLSIFIGTLWIVGTLPQFTNFWKRRSWDFKDRLQLFWLRISAFDCMLCFLRLGLAPTEIISFVFLIIAIVFFALDTYVIADSI